MAVDFDGVIHDHKQKGKGMGQPIEGAVAAMKRLKQGGNTVIIHSVWGDNKEVIGEWCKQYGIPYDDITNIKPQADIYLDDRALRFVTWEDSLKDIRVAARASKLDFAKKQRLEQRLKLRKARLARKAASK